MQYYSDSPAPEDPVKREYLEYAFEITNKFNRAMSRCREISASEKVMGYEDTAEEYLEVANEIAVARAWVNGIFNEVLYS